MEMRVHALKATYDLASEVTYEKVVKEHKDIRRWFLRYIG